MEEEEKMKGTGQAVKLKAAGAKNKVLQKKNNNVLYVAQYLDLKEGLHYYAYFARGLQ